MTLDSLNITKEQLISYLIVLIILLLLIFAFIFVGVAAFAIPGTFGAIINALFPIGNLFIKKLDYFILKNKLKNSVIYYF